MQGSIGLTPKNIVQLVLRKDTPPITVSSGFDSGNMAKAEVGLNHSIIITPANDCSQTSYPSHSKGWFHFLVSGSPPNAKIKFIIRRMSPMSTQLKFADYFRPVFRVRGEEWQRVEQAIVFTKEEDTQLHFDFIFHKNQEVYFAYCYPFAYEDCQKMLRNIQKQIKHLKHIYYKDQVAIKTPENRNVHLLTLSSHDDKLETKEEQISQHLFKYGQRPLNFKQSKKIVIVTARVHPGQTPSSHTFNGLLKFLISNDARAHFLRKHFVFKMIPMLNPDGVARGHYRMDLYGQNLNRFYINPDVERQPSVYAIKTVGSYYAQQGRLCFYLDLHAHPQKKGNFIYGNAMETPQQQVQTQLFARILSLNCIQFDYYNSSFSKYHMNAKDRNEDMTKEGCGRVVFNTQLKVPYAYTMQCGYTVSTYLNEICPIENAHRKFQKYNIISDELQNIKSSYYGKKSNYFTIRSYENLGRNIGVSILDLFQLNPASRLPQTSMKNIQGVRQEILQHINKASMSYINSKNNRSSLTTQGTLKSVKPITKNEMGRGHFLRAPSVQSSKKVGFNKLRNRTIAKVNIGGLLSS